MHSLRFASLLLLAAASVFAQAPAASDSSKPTAPPVTKAFDTAAIDKSADPCVDFYQYACGSWLKSNPIPSDQAEWARSFSQIQERNRYLLWEELDAASGNPQTPLQSSTATSLARAWTPAWWSRRD